MVVGGGAADRVAQLLAGQRLAGWAAARDAGLGLWHEGAFWFSSTNGSRKARNLAGDPRCVVMTEDAMEPVVMEGKAELVTQPEALATILALENVKYETSYTIDLLHPSVNSLYRGRPLWAFGLRDAQARPPAGASRTADRSNRRERRSLL